MREAASSRSEEHVCDGKLTATFDSACSVRGRDPVAVSDQTVDREDVEREDRQ
jgi:hypothetical protein